MEQFEQGVCIPASKANIIEKLNQNTIVFILSYKCHYCQLERHVINTLCLNLWICSKYNQKFNAPDILWIEGNDSNNAAILKKHKLMKDYFPVVYIYMANQKRFIMVPDDVMNSLIDDDENVHFSPLWNFYQKITK